MGHWCLGLGMKLEIMQEKLHKVHSWCTFYRNGSCTKLVQQVPLSVLSVLFSSEYWDVLQKYFHKEKFHQTSKVTLEFTEIKQYEGFEWWEHFQCLCCSIGLQWPNPHNKESLWFSHCLLEEMGKPANCQSTISSLLSHCFSFLGLPWPEELWWPASSTVQRTEGGLGFTEAS